MKKVFVAVSAEFTTDGQVMPRSFTWEDGMRYDIDRILDIRPGSSLKVGGIGLRYTCIISGKQAYMYLDDSKWFMEGK